MDLHTLAPRRRRGRRALVAWLALLALLATVAPAGAGEAAAYPEPVREAATELRAWRDQASATRGPSALLEALGAQAPALETVPGALLVTTSEPRFADAVGAWLDATSGSQRSLAGASSQRLGSRVTEVTVGAGWERAAAALLRARPGVVAVEPVWYRSLTAVPDDPRYPEQWSHQLTGIEQAWDVSTGSADVRVAVIDSGVVATHPDLAGRIESQVDASTGAVLPGAEDNDPCRVGHGTWVAGVVGALGDNGVDVAGVNWEVSMIDVNVADPEAGCAIPDSAIIAGIAHATAEQVDVVNLSLGGLQAFCPTSMQTVLDDARAAGITVVAASGNAEQAFPGQPSVPASCNGVISVGAVGPDGEHAVYSSSNPWVDLAAPGGMGVTPDTGVLTTSWWDGTGLTDEPVRTDSVEAVSGTSFAAPYVAGLAALLLSANPDLDPDDILTILQLTAEDRGDPGVDPSYGHGLVQAGAAMALAVSGEPIPEPVPGPDFPVSDEPPLPRPGGEVAVERLSAGTGETEAVTQAVAVSEALFEDGGAVWAVLARDDDYADALAGSTLGLGAGPVLFTPREGALAEATAAELQRVLEPGSTVYLLGGSVALPTTLEAELEELGLEPVRLAGPVREDTAVAVGEEVAELLGELIGQEPPGVVLANREDWPDAITAGSLGVQTGFPILLTPADQLHPATEAALEALQPTVLLVVGGTLRISDDTMADAARAAGTQQEETIRLSGETRDGTAVEVARFLELLWRAVLGEPPALAVATNLRRADGYAHLLSASPIMGLTGMFLPVEGEDGSVLTELTRDYVRGLGISALLAGDVDIIADATGDELEALLEAAAE